MKYIVKALRNYANFKGRATRPEFWYFYLFYVVIVYGGNWFGYYMFDYRLLGSILGLPLLIPFLACGARRLHDINESGWFMLIPLYNLVLFATKGTEGDNKYGPDPKAPEFTFDFENKEADI